MAVLSHCDNYDPIVATKCQEIPWDLAIFSDTTILQLSTQAIKWKHCIASCYIPESYIWQFSLPKKNIEDV